MGNGQPPRKGAMRDENENDRSLGQLLPYCYTCPWWQHREDLGKQPCNGKPTSRRRGPRLSMSFSWIQDRVLL
jgi:hypothetical protein